jgi:hypothetical protein
MFTVAICVTDDTKSSAASWTHIPTGCPNCESGTLSQDFTEHRVIGLVKGSPTTVGQQAELNAARAGREQMEKMWRPTRPG